MANIRFYSDSQLKTLIFSSVLTRQGYIISEIDKMSELEIYEAISNQLIEGDNVNEMNAIVLSMIELDEIRFNEILKSLIIYPS